MKKILFLFLFVLCSLLGFAQPPTTCPQIVFDYDASGNRIQRKLQIIPCDVQSGKTAQQNDVQESAVPLQVNAYPNPTQDKINIELPEDGSSIESKIELYDLNGKILHSVISPLLQIQVDVSGFTGGTYLLKITRAEKFATYNILKN